MTARVVLGVIRRVAGNIRVDVEVWMRRNSALQCPFKCHHRTRISTSYITSGHICFGQLRGFAVLHIFTLAIIVFVNVVLQVLSNFDFLRACPMWWVHSNWPAIVGV